MDQTHSFGYWLRRRRRALDLTQAALARQVGCATETIKKIETDVRRPSRQMAERIATCLAVPPAERATFLRVARAELSADRLSVTVRPVEPAAGAPDTPPLASAPPRAPGALLLPDSDVPPLKALAAHRTNLPAQPTSLVGREHEVRTLGELLVRPDVRLVTLTGPGGVGKTRLALSAVAELLGDFADGIFFVNLAPIGTPTMVAATIAQTLGVTETGAQSLVECLADSLRERQMLLVLDNFEQVADAAPLLAQLVATAPRLTVLVTSRAVLHVYGEHEIAVPPLALPPMRHPPSLEELAQYPAVRLFLTRAQAVKPTCALSDENAPAIAAICRRLDGLPLAIELAAAWVKLFSPQALLARLEHRLTMLTGGGRDRPARQQTLRAAIAWSYDLLTAPERMLFRRLAVFCAEYTLEAAEAVCNADAALPSGTLAGLVTLADQSLVRPVEHPDGEPRFTTLETIREYALEALISSGEDEPLRHAHARYYLALAARGAPELRGPEQLVWLERLDAEHDHLRAALRWLMDGADADAGLRLAGDLWRFWHGRGYLSEGRGWLEEALARGTARTPARAQALYGAGMLAFFQSDFTRAAQLYEESLAICRDLGDRSGIARALERLGWLTSDQGDYAGALGLFEKSLALFREAGDLHGIASSRMYMGEAIRAQGDYDRARACYEESLALSRALKDTRGIIIPLLSLGDVARLQGNYDRARACYEESLALSRALKDKHMTAAALRSLGAVTHLQGDDGRASSFYEESLALFGELGDRYCGAVTMSGFGRMAYHQGDYGRASALCEASIAVFRALGTGTAIVAASLNTLGYIRLARQEYPGAMALFDESIALAWEEGDRENLARGLVGLARVAGVTGQLEQAARLWGTAHVLREGTGASLPPAEHAENERALLDTRVQLNATTFAAAWAAGRATRLEHAIGARLAGEAGVAIIATASARVDRDGSA